MKKSEIDKVEVLDPNATLDIEKVIGWDKNAREIHPKDFERLKVQIVELGDYKPIIVEKTAEGFTALGGNMRLKAYRELGYKKVWAIVVKPKDDEQRLKLALSDNDRAGYYIADLLAENLKNVNFKNLSDYKVDIRIPDIDMTDILDRAMKSVENEDNVPAVRETSIKIGDMFNLGQHRLLCGDSTLQANVERLMGGKKADMVFTDPPYGVNYSGGIQFGKNGEVKSNQRDKLIADDNADIYNKCIPLMAEYCSGAIYTWFAGTKGKNIYNAIDEVGQIHSLIIWVKTGGYGAMNANYKQKHEPCLYWKAKGGILNFCGETTETTIWNINKDGRNEFHPTQKPIELVKKAILNHNAVSVLDLFLGSGSTLIACELTNRICYGMELDPVYCQVIIDRWEDFTGKKAEVLI